MPLVVLVAGGCLDSEAPPTAAARAPIVDGVREPGEPAVVLLYHDSGAGCTATVIAPRVAITARHCVRYSEGAGALMPASGFHVYVGASDRSIVDEYRVTDVRSTSGSTIDNADFAVLILARDFTHGTKRWEFAPWPGFMAGARITAIGYGQTRFNDPYSAGTKYRRDGVVQAIGPLPRMGLGDREFLSEGENTCQGDSGGPLLYQDVVVGVVSRGEPGCTGVGWMTRVSAFADMVLQALRDTGACVPTGLEVCNGRDDDCSGRIDDLPSCGCTDGAPPSAEVCDGIDNDCNGLIDDLPSCGCTDGAPPSAEVCDGIDNDCNGLIDEVCQHLGEPCADDVECSTGWCGELDGSRVCTAPCGPGHPPCIEDGWCDGPACGEGLCRPGRGSGRPGARCSRNGDCATGLCAPTSAGTLVCARGCVPDTLDCYATEACRALAEGCGACLATHDSAPPRWFGEPCVEASDCLSGDCFTDGDPERCGAGCTYRYCSGGCGPSEPCPAGGHCRDGRCARGPYSEAGDTCVADSDCPGGRCVGFFGVTRCVFPCSAEGGCELGFSCREEVCWPDLLYPGDHCNDGEDQWCTGGLCEVVGGERLCLEPCAAARDCPSGLACVPYGDGLTGGVCVPTRIGMGGGGDDGGCRCSAAGAGSGSRPLLLVAPLLLLALRRPH